MSDTRAEASDFLIDRLINAENRARMIGTMLEAVCAATDDLGDPDPKCLQSLGLVAKDLAEEISDLKTTVANVVAEQYHRIETLERPRKRRSSVKA